MSEIIIPLISLIALEVILGIDNIIFISILADKLPEHQRGRLRFWGIGLALAMRLALLAAISWILKLDKTLFTIQDIDISGKGIILILGGLFLLYKSTKEIYHKTELHSDSPHVPREQSFRKLLSEVILLDLVFSIDSIITAVGMVQELWIMYTAVIVTVIIMLVAAKPISEFQNSCTLFSHDDWCRLAGGRPSLRDTQRIHLFLHGFRLPGRYHPDENCETKAGIIYWMFSAGEPFVLNIHPSSFFYEKIFTTVFLQSSFFLCCIFPNYGQSKAR
jgi:predicted tellurium resistance membrane protein TerC